MLKNCKYNLLFIMKSMSTIFIMLASMLHPQWNYNSLVSLPC